MQVKSIAEYFRPSLSYQLSLRSLFCLFLSGRFTQVLLYFIEEVAKKSKVIADAEKADVHVIDEGFLEAVKRGGAALLISSHSIASWGSDVSYFCYCV